MTLSSMLASLFYVIALLALCAFDIFMITNVTNFEILNRIIVHGASFIFSLSAPYKH